MKIQFKTDFAVRLSDLEGRRLVKVLEDFVNAMATLGPLPAITISVEGDDVVPDDQ